jgi:hypothetical protein
MRNWRSWVGAVGMVVIVGIWGVSLYGVIFGRQITAQVLSCSGISTGRSCEVAWTYGNEHGINSTDGTGAVPGGTVRVTYVPGWGVTNLDSQLIVVVSVPGAAFIVWVRSALRRRGRAAHAGMSLDME